MNETDVMDLLRTIQTHKYVGVASFDAIQSALDMGLIERTDIGNFRLTPKGVDLLDKKISWRSIQNNN